MKRGNALIRNLDGYFFRENFLVASVVTIFVIRLFLKLTDYPQLQGAGLHVAHLLWGGLFMLIALVLLLSFVGRGMISLASIIGGIGFGTFIDELGKFITSDNNYFFQPTIALLYLIFISIYLFSKAIAKRGNISEKEYLVNSLAMVSEAVLNDLDIDEKKRALSYLRKCDQKDPLVISLIVFIKDIDSIPVGKQSFFIRIRHAISEVYMRGANLILVTRIVVVVLLIQAALDIYSGLIVVIFRPSVSITEIGVLISSTLAAVMVIVGMIIFPSSKLHAFKLFKIAILLSLLVTQFFTFYQEQFRALIGLGINIILLTIIDYTIAKESSGDGISSSSK